MLKSLGIFKIKVRILAANDPDNWWGGMDEVEAEKFDSDPPSYKILARPNMDDELEFQAGTTVYCLDDKLNGLCAAWKA